MKNVKLIKASKGWFLTIGDDDVKHRWAVTSLELWCLKKVIEDNLKVVMKEIEESK